MGPYALPNHSHLTPSEIALFLRVHPRTIYRLIAEGSFPYLKFGHYIRVSRLEFVAWYEKSSLHPPSIENKL